MNQTASIIIPALNEQSALPVLFDALNTPPNVEIIVVDGGSTDATIQIAKKAGCRVVIEAGGRGAQLRTGARLARGDFFWFLHADSIPPQDWHKLLIEKAEAVSFSLHINAPGLGFRLIEVGTKLRNLIDGIPYGDQSMWISRSLYERIGGFAAVPLFEDVLLAKAAKEAGTPFVIRSATIGTNARRWQRDGLLKRTLANWRLRIAFELGASPGSLAKKY